MSVDNSYNQSDICLAFIKMKSLFWQYEMQSLSGRSKLLTSTLLVSFFFLRDVDSGLEKFEGDMQM